MNLSGLPNKIGDIYRTRVTSASTKCPTGLHLNDECINDHGLVSGDVLSATFKRVRDGVVFGVTGVVGLSPNKYKVIKIAEGVAGDLRGGEKGYMRVFKLDLLEWFDNPRAGGLGAVYDAEADNLPSDISDELTDNCTATPAAVIAGEPVVAGELIVPNSADRASTEPKKGFNQYHDVVLNYIRENPGSRGCDISKRLDIPEKDVYNLITKLSKERIVVKSPRSAPGRSLWDAVL